MHRHDLAAHARREGMKPTASLSRSLPLLYAVAAVRLSMPFLVLPVMAARLGMEEFGRLGLGLVWAALLALVVEWGFLNAATRQAVPDDAARRFALARQIFTARCVLSVPVWLLGFCIGGWLISAEGASTSRWATAALIACLACAQGWPASWYIQGTLQAHRWARVELVVHLLLLCACLVFAHSVVSFLLLLFLSAGALAALGWRLVWRQLAATPGVGLWYRPALVPGLALGWTMFPASLASAGFTLALPAVAASQMTRSDLGIFFLADRIVRALLASADPLIQLVYPRIVARFAISDGVAFAYAARWAAGGLAFGLLVGLGGWLAWPVARGMLGAIDMDALGAVLAWLGWLVPLAMGWRFLAYWMLGSGRYDAVYRASIYAGAIVGVGGAWWFGQTALALSAVALAAELAIMSTSWLGVMLARKRQAR